MTNDVTKQWVKSCPKLESGLRLGQEGIHACQLGPFSSPIYWTAEEAGKLTITRQMIIEKRKWIFDLLNDSHSETPCKHCHMVVTKPAEEVRFDRLGHIDLAATTTCNLRCTFCGYTQHDSFAEAKYDALAVLRLFAPEDVVWDAAVDFNGGEPTLLKDFDDYIDYFASRRIRVFLYTNGVTFRQSVCDGLANGTIRWACISLDAGTPSTYEKLKKSNRFADVIDNIVRYSEAGRQGGGQVSVKYIFSDGNCGDDDVLGFSYAMLAVRPQEVWLTFDFDPLCDLPGDCADFGGHDYSRHVSAYAYTYVTLAKHGTPPTHFPEKHLAVVSLQGKLLLQAAKDAITRLERKPSKAPIPIIIHDQRSEESTPAIDGARDFQPDPPRVRHTNGHWEPISLAGKRVALAPAGVLARRLLADGTLLGADVIGIFDRDKVLHGKQIDGITVFPHTALSAAQPDVVIVAAQDHNRLPIVQEIVARIGGSSKVLVLTLQEHP